MEVYKAVRWVTTNAVRYGVTVAASCAEALLRHTNDTRIVSRWKRNDKPHKRPIEDGAMTFAAAAAGFVLGDRLAEETGKRLDALHDAIQIKIGKTSETKEDKQKTEPDVVVEVL